MPSESILYSTVGTSIFLLVMVSVTSSCVSPRSTVSVTSVPSSPRIYLLTSTSRSSDVMSSSPTL